MSGGKVSGGGGGGGKVSGGKVSHYLSIYTFSLKKLPLF